MMWSWPAPENGENILAPQEQGKAGDARIFDSLAFKEIVPRGRQKGGKK